MKALVKTTPAPGLTLQQAPDPKPAEGEVVVRVKATSLCGTDAHIYRWDEWAQNRVRLPRIIGHGRASELLYTGRSMSAQEGLAWGYFNEIVPGDKVLARAQDMARSIAEGPWFAHSMTKKCLHQEWNQSIEQSLETEAEAQALCMQTGDFERAYNAFVKKEKPRFEGN